MYELLKTVLIRSSMCPSNTRVYCGRAISLPIFWLPHSGLFVALLNVKSQSQGRASILPSSGRT